MDRKQVKWLVNSIYWCCQRSDNDVSDDPLCLMRKLDSYPVDKSIYIQLWWRLVRLEPTRRLFNVLEHLIEKHCVDVNSKTNRGRTVLDAAPFELQKWLIGKGACCEDGQKLMDLVRAAGCWRQQYARLELYLCEFVPRGVVQFRRSDNLAELIRNAKVDALLFNACQQQIGRFKLIHSVLLEVVISDVTNLIIAYAYYDDVITHVPKWGRLSTVDSSIVDSNRRQS